MKGCCFFSLSSFLNPFLFRCTDPVFYFGLLMAVSLLSVTLGVLQADKERSSINQHHPHPLVPVWPLSTTLKLINSQNKPLLRTHTQTCTLYMYTHTLLKAYTHSQRFYLQYFRHRYSTTALLQKKLYFMRSKKTVSQNNAMQMHKTPSIIFPLLATCKNNYTQLV